MNSPAEQHPSPSTERTHLIVRPAQEADQARWDGFIDAQPHPPSLARFIWRDLLQRHHRATTHFLVVEDSRQNFQGVAALYTVRNMRRRKLLYGLPRGFVASSKEAAASLETATHSLINRENVVAGHFTLATPHDLSSFHRADATNMVMPIYATEEENWSRLRDKTRNMVRKAQRAGITIAHGIEHLAGCYEIYAHEMVQRGVSIHSLRMWQAIAAAYGSNADILVAQKDGQAIAGMVVLFDGRTAINLFQASRLENRNLGPVPLLLWETIRLACSRGSKQFELGTSRPGGNTYKAKSNFGAEPELITRYHIDHPPAVSLVSATSDQKRSPSNLKQRVDRYLAVRAWQPLRHRYNQWKRRQSALF